ncbi:hypothetical protein AAULR_15138 [Lacticaseibacillus rhamnosus MTCC 5462]|nr:hypothetical protein AAULR_15138 [Lacticaseibacillus rhamnosus MTCC 5462]
MDGDPRRFVESVLRIVVRQKESVTLGVEIKILKLKKLQL